MTDLYLEWAKEIINIMAENLLYAPYFQSHSDELVPIVAKKLKSDLEDCIVEEWFCADCDYKRGHD